MRIDLLPADDSSNGWSRILPPRTSRAALSGEIKADWLVIGAGFAGLAAAQRLSQNQPDSRIVLLEAQQAGEGASGRNSGFAIDLPHNVGSSLDELEASRRHMMLARTAIAHLKEQVDGNGIDCAWRQKGKYHTAVSARGAREVLEPFARELDAIGEANTWIEGATLREKLGTRHFTAAVYTPGCVLMNPAALTRGLADSLPGNVEYYEETPVLEIDQRNGVTATTPGGGVFAPKMIVAVNGFAERFGYFKGRLLNFAAHASLTRPLSEDEQAAYGVGEDWGLTPANAFAGITMRYTHDKRFLIRHDIQFQPSMRTDEQKRREVARRHKELFDARFPMLPKVSIEHTWTGYVCLSRNGAPGFGRVASNVHSAVCQNAVGVTKGTIGGILAADMACGVDNPMIADMESLGTPSRLPPRPFLDLGVRMKLGWEVWHSRHEA